YPKDRYQRAEQLGQHLIIVAQRLGGSGALAEGPLYVDAALPQPPRSRPLLVGAVAAVALVVLVLVIGQFSRPTAPLDPGLRTAHGSGSRSAAADSAISADKSSRPATSPKGDGSAPRQALVYDKEASARHLAAFLRE